MLRICFNTKIILSVFLIFGPQFLHAEELESGSDSGDSEAIVSVQKCGPPTKSFGLIQAPFSIEVCKEVANGDGTTSYRIEKRPMAYSLPTVDDGQLDQMGNLQVQSGCEKLRAEILAKVIDRAETSCK